VIFWVIANISVELNKPEKHQAKFCLSRVLLNDIHLLKSSMNEKSNQPIVEQITDKMEELEVDEELDEETLAMKAMGLPTSFTSSLIDRSKCHRRTRSKSPDESSIENIQDDLFKTALDDWLEYWNRDGYQLATNTWTSNSDLNNRSDGHDTSHSSDDSQSEQVLTDLWREHYLSTYDKSLREYCVTHELDYEQFVDYISSIYGENDVRTKNINRNDSNTDDDDETHKRMKTDNDLTDEQKILIEMIQILMMMMKHTNE